MVKVRYLYLAFIPGNNLSDADVRSLIRLSAVLFASDSRLPKIKYLFDKHFTAFKGQCSVKLYCFICDAILAGINYLECERHGCDFPANDDFFEV